MDSKVVQKNKNSSISQSFSSSRYHNNTTTSFTYNRGDKVVTRSYQDSTLNGLGALRLLFYVVFFFVIGRFMFGNGEIFTFGAFLDMLSSAPSVGLDLSIDALQFTNDWGALNVLKQFFNYNLMPLSFVRFLVVNLINVCIFLFHFLFYIF